MGGLRSLHLLRHDQGALRPAQTVLPHEEVKHVGRPSYPKVPMEGKEMELYRPEEGWDFVRANTENVENGRLCDMSMTEGTALF